MNIEEVNDDILADLAGQHRTYFVTSLLSERLDRADLAEVVLYAYGTLAGQGEMEEFRAERPVRDHEAFCDCETSRHFWRGVFDQRGTFFLAKDGKVRKKTGSTSGNLRPTFRVSGTQVLLSRLYDFFRLYSAYPQAAGEHFLKQIDGEKGKVEMSGLDAQMAIYDLYHGAHVGALIDRAADVLEWKPAVGWGIGEGPGCFNPRKPDLSRLRPIPTDLFDAK